MASEEEKNLKSGVVVKGDEQSGQRDFFGVLKEVIELEYDVPNGKESSPIVVLFRCIWFDVYRDGHEIKTDKFGSTRVNTKRFLGTNEPFSLASQEVEAEASFEADNEGDSEGNASNFIAPQQTQAHAKLIYVKLWRKTNSIKMEASFDDKGEVHEKEIQEKGIDSLSIDETYMKVVIQFLQSIGRKGKQNWKLRSNNLEVITLQCKLNWSFLTTKNQRKEKAAREKEEALEKNLQLIMNTLGL
ncbi:putative peroxisomal biogenesis factor 19 [Bienertia sinuspersici]